MTQKFEAITNLKVAQRKESSPNGEIVGARKKMDVIKSQVRTHYHSSLTNHWGTKVDA